MLIQLPNCFKVVTLSVFERYLVINWVEFFVSIVINSYIQFYSLIKDIYKPINSMLKKRLMEVIFFLSLLIDTDYKNVIQSISSRKTFKKFYNRILCYLHSEWILGWLSATTKVSFSSTSVKLPELKPLFVR